MEDTPLPEGLPDLSPVVMSYIALYETFQNLMRGGFDERQALIYLAEMGVAHNRSKE